MGAGRSSTELFAAHGGYEIVAGADYFQDKLDGFGKKFGVPAERLSRTCRLQEVDRERGRCGGDREPAVFPPRAGAAAVEAGKHVYLAKPVAVDVPGCLSIDRERRRWRATKGLMFLVDFQTRADAFYQEAIQRCTTARSGISCFGESHAIMPACRSPAHGRVPAKDPKRSGDAAAGLGGRHGPLRRHHHRAEHPHAGRGELDHEPAAGSTCDRRAHGRCAGLRQLQ